MDTLVCIYVFVWPSGILWFQKDCNFTSHWVPSKVRHKILKWCGEKPLRGWKGNQAKKISSQRRAGIGGASHAATQTLKHLAVQRLFAVKKAPKLQRSMCWLIYSLQNSITTVFLRKYIYAHWNLHKLKFADVDLIFYLFRKIPSTQWLTGENMQRRVKVAGSGRFGAKDPQHQWQWQIGGCPSATPFFRLFAYPEKMYVRWHETWIWRKEHELTCIWCEMFRQTQHTWNVWIPWILFHWTVVFGEWLGTWYFYRLHGNLIRNEILKTIVSLLNG